MQRTEDKGRKGRGREAGSKEQHEARQGKIKIQAEIFGVKGAHAMGLGGCRDKLNKGPHPSSSHGSLRRCAAADAQEVPSSSAADARLEGDSEWDGGRRTPEREKEITLHEEASSIKKGSCHRVGAPGGQLPGLEQPQGLGGVHHIGVGPCRQPLGPVALIELMPHGSGVLPPAPVASIDWAHHVRAQRAVPLVVACHVAEEGRDALPGQEKEQQLGTPSTVGPREGPALDAVHAVVRGDDGLGGESGGTARI